METSAQPARSEGISAPKPGLAPHQAPAAFFSASRAASKFTESVISGTISIAIGDMRKTRIERHDYTFDWAHAEGCGS